MYLIYYVYIIEILYIYNIIYLIYIFTKIMIYILYIIILYTNLHNLHQIHTKKKAPLDFSQKKSDPQHAQKTPDRSQNAPTTKAVIAFISQTPGRLKFQKRLLKSNWLVHQLMV